MSMQSEKQDGKRWVPTGRVSLLHDIRGGAFVELVFLLPILLVLLFGVIDFGRLIHARLVVTNVSREGGSLSCRDLYFGNELFAIIQSSATPFDLNTQGLIIITKVGAADTTKNRLVPYIINQDSRGSLSVSSSVSGNNLNTALPETIKYLELGNSGISEISGITVVEVFYRYMPITPLPNFLQNVFINGGGIILGSRSVFPSAGE
jgi:Flp pilus assembly protein TadG